MNELFSPTLVAESDNIAAIPTTLCEQCAKPFERRTGSGGKPQKFCSEECRRKYKPQRGPTPPTPSIENGKPGVAQPAEKDASAGTAADFDWSDTDSVILPEQPATACYFNPRGELGIRQKQGPDDHSFIYIAPDFISEFVDKLTDIIGIPSVGRPKR